MTFLTQKALVLAKIEVTYGVDPVPAPATDAILVEKDSLQVRVDNQLITRNFVRDNISRLSGVVGRKVVEVQFDTELKGSGAAGTAPRHGVLHRACAMSETIVASTSVAYDPISTGFESVTLYAYFDGILHKITGCYGTCRIIERVNAFGLLRWSFKGLWNDPADAAIASGAVFDATKPVPIESLALTLGGYQVIAESLEIDMGIEIAERPDINSPEGLKGLQVVNRAVGGSINPEAVSEVTHPFWANFKNATEVALAGNTVGTVAGNKVQTTGPKIQYEAPQWGDRGGNRIYQLPVRLNPSTDAAEDEIKILYT